MASHVLVVDDQSNVRSTIAYLLDKEGYRVTKAASGQEALGLLEGQEFEFALIDVKMARMDGLELLRRIRARWPGVAVILMTAYASIPSAVDAMKMGAAHYLEKPFTKEKLLEAFARAKVEFGASVATGLDGPFDEIVDASPSVIDTVDLARKNASNDKPLLLLGENGTGRETLARAVHAASPRAAGPFVPVRCSTLADRLETEVFAANGRLAESASGTIYLDGVGHLTDTAQSKLLLLIQDGEVPGEQGTPPMKSDARVMAASELDLEELVGSGRFRQDLYLRLRAVQLRLPPLHERIGDLPRLVKHYATRLRVRGAAVVSFDRPTLNVLATLPFTGNLKELEDLVEQAVGLATDGEVTTDVLTRLGIEASSDPTPTTSAMRTRVEVEERRVIEEELRKSPKNLKQVAENLNISRTTLWRKMKKYDLHPR